MSLSPPKNQRSGQNITQAPLTLAQLLGMVLKNVFKRGLLRIPLALFMAFLTMIIHTFLLVGPNGGFGAGVNPVLDSVLALQGRVISGSLFWALLAGMTTAMLSRLRQAGISGTLQGIQKAPAWVKKSLQADGIPSQGILLLMAALALFLGAWLNNRLVSLQLVILAFGALIAQHESFAYLVTSAAWGDGRRLLKRPPAQFNPAFAGVGIAGALLGFGAATILPFVRFLGCAGGFILIGLAFALFFLKNNKPGAGQTLLILSVLLSLAMLATPVFADDGGWSEGGGSFSSWVTSEGAAIAVAYGIPPSLATLLGILLGSSIAGINGFNPGTLPNVAPDIPVPTSPNAPTDEWAQQWIKKGWVWSDQDDGFVPKSGAISEDGQVWYHPPWDQGGAYWVDKAEYVDIQQHLSNGDTWSDRWGWKPPDEIQQLDKERDDRWNKFTDPAESRKQHDQMMQQIQQQVANDPVMQELKKIQERLDAMKRESLQQDIDYYQKQSDYYTKRAEYYDKLYHGAKFVKSGADLAIDTLGMAPGAGRVVKYGYKFVSNTAQTTIETGSLVEGVTKGTIETGKAVIGDKIGDNLSIPGVDSPTNWSKIPAKTFVQKVVTSPYNAKQLIFNKAVDSGVSEELNQIENGIRIITGTPGS